MRLGLTDEQEYFRENSGRLLEDRTPLSEVRDLYDSKEGFARPWWRQAAELGWTSLLVPESLGGGSLSGCPVSDATIVAEEMGRLVAPGPFLPVNIVAAAVAMEGSKEQIDALLPGLLGGASVASWAVFEPDCRYDSTDLCTSARVDGDTVVIDGRKAYVEAAASSEYFLVVARGDGGLTQVLVPTDTPGVRVLPGRSLDMTRRFGQVIFQSVRLPVSAVVGQVGEAGPRVTRLLHTAVALQCAELVGIADRVMEFTVEYGRDRLRVQQADRIVPGDQAPYCKHDSPTRRFQGDRGRTGRCPGRQRPGGGGPCKCRQGVCG